jgi:3-deoxy-7-phosphoheptulonate synthase
MSPLYTPDDRTSRTDDERIADITPLPPPEHLIRFFPIKGTPMEKLVLDTRHAIRNIVAGQDPRILVVVGPCSIHDPAAAVEYARRLKPLRERYRDKLEVVMRVYFEKPRTTVGWKGLINDPYLDESYRIDEGLRIARQLMLDINRAGVPAASEFLDVISPQYIGDLIAWGAIGARTTESQVHRELASGLSAPIGFKNGTDGNIKIATDAIQGRGATRTTSCRCTRTARWPSCRPRATRTATSSCAAARRRTTTRPASTPVCAELRAAKLAERVMVDCSHANSSKQHERQLVVADELCRQWQAGRRQVFGVMVESHLKGGAQKFSPGKDDPTQLEYGQSITDACIDWAQTEGLLAALAAASQA